MSNLMIVSEDSSVSTFTTLQKLLLLISEKEDLNVSEIVDCPLELKKLATANAWLSKKQKYVDFVRILVNELDKLSKYLVWHIDGDCKFSEYHEECGNIAKFRSLIANLPERLPVRRGSGFVPVFKDNIITMVPCYSIEAWLFQNKAFYQEIIDKVEKQLPHVSGNQKEKLNQIIENLKVLQELPCEEFEEILKIKELFPIRESKNFYPKMAEGLPHDELMKIDKSYAKFVKKLKELIAP